MKLYYAPGACSLSPHIVLCEAQLPHTLVKTDVRNKKLPDGSSFLAVNPKGQVPVLELDDGSRITEGPAIVQYLADLAPAAKLAPPAGTMERVRVQEWLNFITSELHKNFAPLFAPNTPDDYKPVARARLVDRFGYVDGQLAGRDYLFGSEFSVADAYLFVVAGWSPHAGVDIGSLANVQAFLKRVGSRPAVQAAMKAEGLLK
jgi:glutathione S-transferase